MSIVGCKYKCSRINIHYPKLTLSRHSNKYCKPNLTKKKETGRLLHASMNGHKRKHKRSSKYQELNNILFSRKRLYLCRIALSLLYSTCKLKDKTQCFYSNDHVSFRCRFPLTDDNHHRLLSCNYQPIPLTATSFLTKSH